MVVTVGETYMKWKQVFGLIMIILVIMIVLFFFKYNSPLIRIKEDFITYFENKSNLSLEVGEINCWPLNRFIIKDLKLKKDDVLLISIPEVKMYYNISRLLSEPERWFDSLTYISIDQPAIVARDYSYLQNQQQLSEIITFLQEVKIDVKQGHISFEDNENNYSFRNINAVLQKNELRLETEAKFKKISYAGYNINNLTTGKLVLNLNLFADAWEGTLLTESLDLSTLMELFLQNENLNIKGSGQALVKFKGFKSKLRDYNGKIEVSNAEVNFKQVDYIKKSRINNVSGEIGFQANDKNLTFNNFNFSYSQNNYKFNGLLKLFPHQVPQVEGKLTSDNLELSHIGLAIEETGNLNLSGEARLNLYLKGKLTSPEMDMNIYLPRGKIREEVITHLKTHIRYSNEFFYVDLFDLQLNKENYLKLSGIYNFNSSIYSFNLNGRDVDVKMLEKYFAGKLPVNNVDGKANFILILNGKGLNFKNLNANGKMEILSPQIGYNNYKTITAKLWLADRFIMINDGLLKLNKGEIAFSGQANLIDNSINFNLNGEGLDTELINNFIEDDIQVTGDKLSFTGNLLNTLDTPELDIELSIAEGKIKGVEFTNLTAHTIYNKNKLYIDGLDFTGYNSHVQGSALIDFTADNTELSADLSIANIECDKIADIIDSSLPINGNIDRLELSARGSIAEPLIKGIVSSNKLSFSIDEKELPLVDTNISFVWQKGEALLIDNLSARQNNAVISLSGTIAKQNLNLDFEVNKFNLSNLDLAKDINSQLSLTGTVKGDVNSPVVDGNIFLEDITVKGQDLQDCEGELTYCDQTLKLGELIWNTGSGEYKISGIVKYLATANPYININIKAKEGDLDQILNIINYKLPLQQNYKINGALKINGYIDELIALLDIKAQGVNDIENCINLKGEIGKTFDLQLNGENVKISDIYEISPDLELDILASIDFSGDVKGTIDDLNINMQTTANNTKINNVTVDKITGNASLKAGENLKIEQLLIINDNKLAINGDINLGDEPEIDLNFYTREFPLAIVTGVFSPQVNLKGYLDGEVNINGYIKDLTADGQVHLAGKDIELGLPAKINYVNGSIVFRNKEIELMNFQGYYANKPISVTGMLFPFASQDFWNLKLTGMDLPFDSGSIDGEFNPDLTINGTFKKPKISGGLVTHDLIIEIPFNFSNDNMEGLIEPELDIVLKPGNDIYIKNQYLDILVEKGSLRLINEDDNYLLEGKVSSRQGSFDYYNNKFIMEKGYADFRKFNSNIPEIWASAYTYVKGIKVYININGLANNMLMTFHSQPELPRNKIINLLVSKGGLGELTAEKDASLPDFLKKELTRFFQKTFQLEFIENIEEKLKEIFELDRMEIDTYQLGFNEDIAVYLGKRFNEKFYLQYSRTFSLDDTINYQKPENELSFYYYLNDKTHLEGSWLGDDDFSITIETELKF